MLLNLARGSMYPTLLDHTQMVEAVVSALNRHSSEKVYDWGVEPIYRIAWFTPEHIVDTDGKKYVRYSVKWKRQGSLFSRKRLFCQICFSGSTAYLWCLKDSKPFVEKVLYEYIDEHRLILYLKWMGDRQN